MKGGGGGTGAGGDLGPATNRNNDPVWDPSRNVLDLVDAAVKRQDDLRKMESKHLREILKLRTEMYNKLRKAEAHRIDAIRAVDVAALSRASEVAEQRASTLAAQVASTAEAFRVNLAAALEPIQKDIADLRRVQYEGVGSKTQVTESRSTSGSVGLWIGLAVGGLSFFVSLIAVGFAVFVSLNP